MERVHLIISGDVTGVGFRFSTIQIARELGLTGWVRNTENAVEIVAEGPRDKLENLVTWVHKGPPLAQVEKVDIDWQEATGDLPAGKVGFKEFEVT